MNYDRVPVTMCVRPTCTKGAGGLGAYQSRTGRRYCSQACHDADPLRDTEPPRADVPKEHQPEAVGALKAGWR